MREGHTGDGRFRSKAAWPPRVPRPRSFASAPSVWGGPLPRQRGCEAGRLGCRRVHDKTGCQATSGVGPGTIPTVDRGSGPFSVSVRPGIRQSQTPLNEAAKTDGSGSSSQAASCVIEGTGAHLATKRSAEFARRGGAIESWPACQTQRHVRAEHPKSTSSMWHGGPAMSQHPLLSPLPVALAMSPNDQRFTKSPQATEG